LPSERQTNPFTKAYETIHHNQHPSRFESHSSHPEQLAIDRNRCRNHYPGSFIASNFTNHHLHIFQMTFIVTFTDGRQVTVWANSHNNAGQAAIEIRCKEKEPGDVPPIRSIAHHPYN
jgi:hypothetical protein